MAEIELTKILSANRITLPKQFVIDAKLKECGFIGYRYIRGLKKIEIFVVKYEEEKKK